MFIVIFFLLLGGAFGWSLGLDASIPFLIFSTVVTLGASAAIAIAIPRRDGTLRWDLFLALASFATAFACSLWYAPHA
ncbi:MAG TPA: hypothetical protein VLB83_00160 [Candidatus Paceibacterota bacterium]|nr:hypothetical protein [Candidatus Paceibacterota bacterium]